MFLINLNTEIVVCILSFTSDFPFKNICKSAQHTETIGKNVWEKSNEKSNVLVVDDKSTNKKIILFRLIKNMSINHYFRSPGFSPYMGRKERRVQGLDYLVLCFFFFCRGAYREEQR